MTTIECKLIREGGSFPEVGGTVYHFAPNAEGAHVCDVLDADHADVFLSIPEGYRLYRGAAKAAAPVLIAKAEQAEPEQALTTMLASEPEAPAEKTTAEIRAELAAEFERLYGEAPHPRTGIDKLRKLIADKQTV